MGSWLESYKKLPEDAQDRVQRWLHLNKFISRTLRIPWENWVDQYLQPAMDKPMNYDFMKVCLPNFDAFDGTEGQGVTFSKEVDPATALVARVPLRAQNNLGRLSPALQDALGSMMEQGEPKAAKLLPGDVVHLQKIFASEKALAKLKRKDFRSLFVRRDDDDIAIFIRGGDEILRLNVLEFSGMMSKALI